MPFLVSMIFDGLGFRKEVWFSDKKIMNLFLIKITADGRKGQRGPLTPHPAPAPAPPPSLYYLDYYFKNLLKMPFFLELFAKTSFSKEPFPTSSNSFRQSWKPCRNKIDFRNILKQQNIYLNNYTLTTGMRADNPFFDMTLP